MQACLLLVLPHLTRRKLSLLFSLSYLSLIYAGCAQMMCKRCKHVFCWYCLTSLDISSRSLFSFLSYLSVTFWCGIDPDSAFFLQWPLRQQQKISFWNFLLFTVLFVDTFTSFFKDKKSQKKSQNSRNPGFSYYSSIRTKKFSFLPVIFITDYFLKVHLHRFLKIKSHKEVAKQ